MTEGKKTVTILGAGFSGLVSAYFLERAGFQVTVHEASDRVGGVIQTLDTELGKIETAANGVLNSIAFQDICDEIGVKLVSAKQAQSGRSRFIFRGGKAKRWPLTLGETLSLIPRIFRIRQQKPMEGETIEAWSLRSVGAAAYHSLVIPALQGIYAGDPEKMDASLILSRFYGGGVKGKKMKPQKKGTVSPQEGMGFFLQSLALHLEKKEVRILRNSRPDVSLLPKPLVIAVSLKPAVQILEKLNASVSVRLARVETLPLLSVSLSFSVGSQSLDGFGCLFARDEGIRSLGVLFENLVFPGRSPHHLERWILGGANDRSVMELADSEIREIILADRARMTGRSDEPLEIHVTRHADPLPHYTAELAQALGSPEMEALNARGIYLIGNYTGKLGLSGILESAEALGAQL